MTTFKKSDIETYLKFCVASYQNLAGQAEGRGDIEAAARHRRTEQFVVVLLNSIADNYSHADRIELDQGLLNHLLNVALG